MANDENSFHILRVKGEAVIATSLEGGGVGGVPITTHYDERKLSVAAMDTIRRGSVGTVTVKGITGGVDRGDSIGGMKRFSVADQGAPRSGSVTSEPIKEG